jgi:hypothetical protein
VRTGIFISAFSHVVLVAFALLGTPKLFDSVPLQAIEVDLVREAEPEPPPMDPEKKPPEKSTEWNPLPEASTPQARPSVPETATAPAKPKQPPTQQARAQPPADPPRQKPQQPASPPPAETQQPWAFDPVHIPALMNLPTAPQGDFDSESTTMANLSADERTTFKAHLKKCWKLPDGMSPEQSTRVTLRIFLKPDGGLAAEPTLIEASASREGPLLMQAAIRSVKECQPFNFLPADRYREWKTLDVRFSPREMAGG